MDPPRDVLLVGCGDLGSRIGLRLADRGHRVFGIRRRAAEVPAPLLGIGADLTKDRPVLPDDLDLRHLVVALTARPRTAAAYRATYVDGMTRALDALESAGQRPHRAVLVSSTAVFGDLGPEPPTDESTEPRPTTGTARALLDSERLFAARLGGTGTGATVLRLSGLYGVSGRLVDQVRSGAITDPDRWTNRIHREDAADAVVHLLTRTEEPEPLYVGNDDEPALLGDVAAHLASCLARTGVDVPEPPRADPAHAHGRRLTNARLRSSGWAPQHPSYREGYAAALRPS